MNNRAVARDTEQDILLAPASFWSMFLQPKLDALLSKKITSRKRIKPDDSDVVVSVNERSERDLVRRFDEVHVDWQVVEKQLVSWATWWMIYEPDFALCEWGQTRRVGPL